MAIERDKELLGEREGEVDGGFFKSSKPRPSGGEGRGGGRGLS